MKKGGAQIEREDVPVEDEDLSTAQDGVVVPYLAGTTRCSVRWFTPATDRVAIQAQDDLAKK